jgi:hypothetical protein
MLPRGLPSAPLQLHSCPRTAPPEKPKNNANASTNTVPCDFFIFCRLLNSMFVVAQGLRLAWVNSRTLMLRFLCEQLKRNLPADCQLTCFAPAERRPSRSPRHTQTARSWYLSVITLNPTPKYAQCPVSVRCTGKVNETRPVITK